MEYPAMNKIDQLKYFEAFGLRVRRLVKAKSLRASLRVLRLWWTISLSGGFVFRAIIRVLID